MTGTGYKRAAAVLIAVMMCISMIPAEALAQDGAEKSGREMDLLVFGNSTASGFGMPDFLNWNKGFASNNNYLEEWAAEADGYTQSWTDEKAFTYKAALEYVESLETPDEKEEAGHVYRGLGRMSNAAYPWQLKKYIVEKQGYDRCTLMPIVVNGMRTDELRAFLDKDYYDKISRREYEDGQRYLDDNSDTYIKTGEIDEQGRETYMKVTDRVADLPIYERDYDTDELVLYTVSDFCGFLNEHVDAYIRNFRNSKVTENATYDDASAYIRKSIGDADVIVLDLAGNSFGSYVGYRISAMLGQRIETAPALYETIADVEDVPAGVRNTIDSLVKKLADQYPAISSGAARQLLDAYIYAVADSIVNFSADVEMIREINPDARIIAVGVNNQMSGLVFDAGGTDIPFGKAVGMLLGTVNTYMKALDKNAGNYYFADVPEKITSFVDSIREAETIEEAEADGAYEDGRGAYAMDMLYSHFNEEYMSGMFAGTAEDFYNNVLAARFKQLGLNAKPWDEMGEDEIISLSTDFGTGLYLTFDTAGTDPEKAISIDYYNDKHPVGKPTEDDHVVYLTKRNIAGTTGRIRQLIFDAAHAGKIDINSLVGLMSDMDSVKSSLVQYVFGFRDDMDGSVLSLICMLERFVINSSVGDHPNADGCEQKFQAVLAGYLSSRTSLDEVKEQLRKEIEGIYSRILEISGKIREAAEPSECAKYVEELRPLYEQLKLIALAAYQLPEYEKAVDAYSETISSFAGEIAELEDAADGMAQNNAGLAEQAESLEHDAEELRAQLAEYSEKEQAIEEKTASQKEEIERLSSALRALEEKKAAFEFAQLKPSLKKVKAGKKSLSAYWKKAAGAEGYQISYKTGKKIVKKTAAEGRTSLKIKKLRKGKKYTVKVRAYRVLGGKKIYSKWSSAKKIKVK